MRIRCLSLSAWMVACLGCPIALGEQIALSTTQPTASRPALPQMPLETVRRSFHSKFRQA